MLKRSLVFVALALSLNACSTFHEQPSAKEEPKCTPSNEWLISNSKKKIEVKHNFKNNHEHCDQKAEVAEVSTPHAPKVERHGSVQDLLVQGGITAKVAWVLDPTEGQKETSKVEFRAI